MKDTDIDPNQILIENKRTGTSNWRLTNPAINREIEGYASKSSVNKGDSVLLFVNTQSSEFTITIYRMGWYEGKGGREIVRPITLKGSKQHIPLPKSDTGFVECAWENPYKLTTAKEWVCGVYVAKLEEKVTNKQSYILFVVRDDEQSPDILFQLPVTTYQAYNYWGGKCLYDHGSGSIENWGTVDGIKATKVSFNRPYAGSNNPKAAYGMGAGDFFTNTRPVTTHDYPTSSAGWDYNTVRWLEKNNYDVGYITSIDTHANPALLLNSKIFLSSGHDEYWSHEMRTNVKKIRDSGINLVFFSSNTMYWQIRFENEMRFGQPFRTMVCYKEKNLDPVKDHTCTTNFTEIPEQGSQASLIGVQYFIDPVAGDIKITNPGHWAFENTGLKYGSRLKGLLGYEIDGITAESPKNIVVLAASACKRIGSDRPWFIIEYMFTKILDSLKQILEKKIGIPKKYSFFVVIFSILLGFIIAISIDTLIFILAFLVTVLFFILWFFKIFLGEKSVSNMTIYKAESGAYVFATGSMQWVWGLDDFNTPQLRESRKSETVDIITKNVLTGLGAKKGYLISELQYG